MKKIRLRSGIILTTICGQYLLIATPEAMNYCKRVSQINPMAADIVKFVASSPKSMEEIIEQIMKEYRIPEENDINAELQAFIEVMAENGYLIEV